MVKKIRGEGATLDPVTYIKILQFFFDNPTNKFSLSDLAKIVSIHKQTASSIIKELQKEGFLELETIGRVWRITCNQNHQFNATQKISYHLNLIYQTEIVDTVRKVVPQAKNIILFGSYRKGDDVESSDIDIAAEIVDDKNIEIVKLGVVSKLGYRKNIPVNLHIFSRNNINLNLFNNIANGIVLDVFLEVRP